MKKVRGQVVYPIKERLKRNSRLNPNNGCIEWQGSTSHGYGRLMVGSRTDGTRKTTTAHRASYEAHIGPIPDGLFVCHHCDNRRCINPGHLFVGTRQDNVDDRERKGRNDMSGIRKLRGERHPSAKLTWSQVLEARKRYTGVRGQIAQLAREYGVASRTIRDAISGRRWASTPAAPTGAKEG